MRRVRFSVAMSLDGFIAGPNGETDWIVMDPEIDFGALMGSFDTVLLGRKSYDATRAYGSGGMPGMQTIVASRTLDPSACAGVTVTIDPAGTLGTLRGQPGKDIWLFGGGNLVASLLPLGVVDSVEIALIPVLLGQGVPLSPVLARVDLRLVSQRALPTTGTVLLAYAVA